MNIIPLTSVHGGTLLVNLDHVYIISEETFYASMAPFKAVKVGDKYSILRFASGYSIEVGESNFAILQLTQKRRRKK